MAASTSDFRLTFAGPDFKWAGETREGLPILRWPDGTLCEPVLAYFGYSAEMGRVQVSSMRPEAYAIREWLAFLRGRKVPWNTPSDILLREWRESHRTAVEAKEISPQQVERKIECVFEFYRLLPSALPLDERLESRQAYVAVRGAPITSRFENSPDRTPREVWAGSQRTARCIRKRGVPDEAQVTKVLTHLRSTADLAPTRRIGETHALMQSLDAERNWLIGRCMVDGGLRAEETCDLSVTAISKALWTEGGLARGISAEKVDEAARDALLRGLDAMQRRHRRCIYVEIVGKGKKARMAPFSIDLIRDLLSIGIWEVRRRQVEAWTSADPSYAPPANLFLSSKSRRALKSGTVSDLMKDAFTAAQVDGSGHRLRAHYATMTAAAIWEECFALNGFRFDQTVVNMALERLAEAMGHRQVTTTVRHYLDMALLKEFGVAKRERLSAVQSVWNALVQGKDALTPRRVLLLKELVSRLTTTRDGSDLEEILVLALADDTLRPRDAQPSNSKGSHLKLVQP